MPLAPAHWLISHSELSLGIPCHNPADWRSNSEHHVLFCAFALWIGNHKFSRKIWHKWISRVVHECKGWGSYCQARLPRRIAVPPRVFGLKSEDGVPPIRKNYQHFPSKYGNTLEVTLSPFLRKNRNSNCWFHTADWILVKSLNPSVFSFREDFPGGTIKCKFFYSSM